jgi:SAM-dependent methyltransferase
MFEFHGDRKRYFEIQRLNSAEFVIPFIEKIKPLTKGINVLEIGCGEAGVLVPFLERGCNCAGVELETERLKIAEQLLPDFISSGKLKLIGKNIYNIEPVKEFGTTFDIIILKDVIEHIHNQQKLINEMKRYLNKNGVIFFGFPPWQMPFGGHQQMCSNKYLSKLPYFHLLPKKIYKRILTSCKEQACHFLEIKETGISIERFERIVKNNGYTIVNKTHFLFNPIYKYKFALNPKKQFAFISKIPWIRNFLTTCVYYLIEENNL